jgi:hypothetical protein
MIGVGQCRHEPSDKEAAKAAALWGSDPVHPTSAAYRLIAEQLEEDLRDEGARYTNPTRVVQPKKKPRHDPSLERDGWVSGCSAALSRRDTAHSTTPRGSVSTRGSWAPSYRGQRPFFRGRSSGGPIRGSHWGNGLRRFSGGGGEGVSEDIAAALCHLIYDNIYFFFSCKVITVFYMLNPIKSLNSSNIV